MDTHTLNPDLEFYPYIFTLTLNFTLSHTSKGFGSANYIWQSLPMSLVHEFITILFWDKTKQKYDVILNLRSNLTALLMYDFLSMTPRHKNYNKHWPGVGAVG